MRRLFATLGVLALTAGAALAQDAAKKAAPKAPAAAGGNAAVEKAIAANENKVLEAITKHDKEGFTALMGPGSVSADEMGFMTADQFVPMMDQVKMTAAKISDSKFMWADASTVVHYYTWTGSGTFQGQSMKSPTYSSTVWTKKDGKWVAVFHQESAAAPAPPKK